MLVERVERIDFIPDALDGFSYTKRLIGRFELGLVGTGLFAAEATGGADAGGVDGEAGFVRDIISPPLLPAGFCAEGGTY